MLTYLRKKWLMLPLALVMLMLLAPQPALACGGLFCQNAPVDQNAERIIFTQNRDGSTSAIIQIQYTGFAEDFSWILPISSPITGEDIEVPETAMTAFTELEIATVPIFIPPQPPKCVEDAFDDMVLGAVAESAADDSGVTIFDSGEVGPYEFDVVGSEDPDALIIWLRDHDYQVTEQMEPLINVYVEEQFVFLAMRLQPDQGAQDIQPVKVTYDSSLPMIPLRLTAVAANPDMAIIIWIYGDNQAVPDNYAHMEIADDELTFFTFGGHNYRQLMGERADEFGGQAFITEYAAPTRELPVADPLLVELANDYAYVTRLNTVISPEEMTVDPVFVFDAQRRDVSNIHDLSGMTGLYDCEREATTGINLPLFGGQGNNNNNNQQNGNRPDDRTFGSDGSVTVGGGLLTGVIVGAAAVVLLMGFFGLVLIVIRQSRR